MVESRIMTRAYIAVLATVVGCSDEPEPQADTDQPERLVDVVDDNEEKIAGTVQDERVASGYAHFGWVSNESVEAFCMRADRRVATLEHDRLGMLARASAAADPRPRELLVLATEALAEARSDVAELRGAKERLLLDDGRPGVAAAINRAQRALSDAAETLAAPRS